jgi:MSHA biogenesis protein MshJ
MKAIFLAYAARFDALSVRERLMVLAACVAAASFLVHSLMLAPRLKQRAQLNERIEQQQRIATAARDAAQLLTRTRTDPDAQLRAQRDGLRNEIVALDAELKATMRSLVPPERMPELLEALVRRDSSLKILALRSITATPLVVKPVSKPDPGNPAQARDAAGVFKQGIELTAEGSYADLSAYVARLERMPVKMYWSRAVLDASAYPRVLLTLTLFTLSFDRSLLML